MANLREALRRKAIHRSVDVQSARALLKTLSKNDLVILASPVRAIREILSSLPRDVLVTDVGSTKASIVAAADKLGLRFVGGHPIAGTENTGAKAGDLNLFKERLWILTPGKKAQTGDVAKLAKLWKQLGAKTQVMKAAEHDRIFATVSHLPHVVAMTLLLCGKNQQDKLQFIGSGFNTTTRIAKANLKMWRDIFFGNRQEILKQLTFYQNNLTSLEQVLRNKDQDALDQWLQSCQQLQQPLGQTE